MHYLCFKDFANWTHRTLKRKHWIDNARLISGCGSSQIVALNTEVHAKNELWKYRERKTFYIGETPTHYCQPSQCFVQFDNVTGSASLCWFWPYSLTQLTCFWKLLVCLCLMCFIANTEVRRMKNTAWKSAMVYRACPLQTMLYNCAVVAQLALIPTWPLTSSGRPAWNTLWSKSWTTQSKVCETTKNSDKNSKSKSKINNSKRLTLALLVMKDIYKWTTKQMTKTQSEHCEVCNH